MQSKFLAVLGLCIAVSILTAADAEPRRHLGSKNDYDYGRSNNPNKPHHKHPSNYRRRLEDAKAKATESSDYDYGHDDYEHKGYDYDGYDYKGYADSYGYGNKGYSGGDCDDYDYKGYGYSFDYKSYSSDCDDYGDDYYGYGNDYYGFDKGYGYGDYPAYSYGSGYGYGGDYGFYPGVSGYGYPSYSYYSGYGNSGYGFPGYFGYESSAVDAGTKKFDAMTEEGAGKSAEKKAAKTPSKETTSKSDAANKLNGK